jgi:predicted phage terminase large subunit-like protein
MGISEHLGINVGEVDAELARRSLREFVRVVWPHIERRKFIQGWHIDAICDHLEAVSKGQIRRLIINIPPRHLKSLIVAVFWPAWEWARNPDTQWIFASYAERLSVRDSVRCRRVIQSAWYQKYFGHSFNLTSDQNEKMKFDNDRGGHRIATSVGGTGTGEGADRIVVDDPHKVIEVESEVERTKVLEWWDQEMSTRGNDPRKSAYVIIMQRLHEKDLTGHCLETGLYDHLCLPAEYEGESRCKTKLKYLDPRKEPNELIQPERFTQAATRDQKLIMGTRAWASQFQQRPAPLEGDILKMAWFKTYDILPKQKFHEMIQSWDLSFKDTPHASYVCGQVWGRIDGDIYLLDQIRSRLSFVKTIEAIMEMTKAWPKAYAKLVEDKANGPAVISTLKHKVPGIIPVNPRASKASRTIAVSPLIEAGNVYLPTRRLRPWIDKFLLECLHFPNGAYSDQVDAMTQALERLGRRTGIVNVVPFSMTKVSVVGRL